jgi:hypothetical protein
VVLQNEGSGLLRVGFFATRVVRAADPESARKMGTKAIEDEVDHRRFRGNEGSEVPSVEISEFEELDELPSPLPAGFTWFRNNVAH